MAALVPQARALHAGYVINSSISRKREKAREGKRGMLTRDKGQGCT
jgi:hypothetical protein